MVVNIMYVYSVSFNNVIRAEANIALGFGHRTDRLSCQSRDPGSMSIHAYGGVLYVTAQSNPLIPYIGYLQLPGIHLLRNLTWIIYMP